MRNLSTTPLVCLLCIAAALPAADKPDKAKPAVKPATPSKRADSIHVAYRADKEIERGAKVIGFYTEIKIVKTKEGTFFMAAGFQHGYFGVQDLWRGKRVVIFSCWDGKGDPRDPKKVAVDNRTKVIYKGKDVRAGRFGGEGTGAQSFYTYPWTVGETMKFYLQAKPMKKTNSTRYTGWFYLAKEKVWKKIATFERPGSANTLGGHHSFVEDFTGHAADKYPREMLCGPAWLEHEDGKWVHAPYARTSQSPRNHKHSKLLNTDFGIVGNLFRMTTGADTKQTVGPNQWLKLPTAKPIGKPADKPKPETKPAAKKKPVAPKITLPEEPETNVPAAEQTGNIRTRP